MKIIHCADLHLDSAMQTHLTPHWAKMRRAELLTSFARLVDYALEKGVQAVLLAGDIFDGSRVSGQTLDYVMEQIRRAGSVDFFYLRGNHDAQVELPCPLPENLKTFSGQWRTYRYDEVTVSGIQPEEYNEDLYDRLRLSPQDCNIVMLHGQKAASVGEDLVPLPLLRGKHIHYLALGHIHSHQWDKLDMEGIFCYSGCLEGRGFDECGEKGFVELDIEKGNLRWQFVPFGSRSFYEVPVDITDCATASQIKIAMERTTQEISRESFVKFILKGSFLPETQKDIPFLEKVMENRFFYVKIQDESRLHVPEEAFAGDISLAAEFIRLVKAAEASQEEKDQMIYAGLQALRGEEIIL